MKKNLLNLVMISFLMLFVTTSCSSDDNIIVNEIDKDDEDDDQEEEEEEEEEEEQPKEVHFNDARLELVVKNLLGLEANDPITEENILELVELNIDGSKDVTPNGDIREISDLTGLEYALNLTYLHFGETKVTDLQPIGGLQKMDYLRMNDTGVTDLTPISAYTTLTYFNANTTTGITDISPLAGNTGLKEIILRSVPFGDAGMATIANFTNLYRINMRSTGVTDITVLGQLMSQGALLDTTPGAAAEGGATLDLRGLDVEDWSPIEPYLDQISNLEGYPG